MSRFESSRVILLLARLALSPQRIHPREELAALLWPDADRETGLARLRHVLSSLRHQLEPSDIPPGSVLTVDRRAVRLNPEAFTTDVADFERASGRREGAQARELYRGEFLPGLWDDWVLTERERLKALYDFLPETDDSCLTVLPVIPETNPAASLPSYLTVFVGRHEDRRALKELLNGARLVTVLGLGGIGKTRIAIEVVRALPPRFTRAVFVPLAKCFAPQQVPANLRAALGLPPSEQDALEQVALHLGDEKILVVLDNFEQLVEGGGAEVVRQILAQIPHAMCLVTSRRALQIPGERLFALSPLMPLDALALFLDRAQSVRLGFRLTEGNQQDVDAVCEALEGIPLALELAASRLRALSPSEMRRGLESRFEWLRRTGFGSDREGRHHSLIAALEWSWQLLAPDQQKFLAALTVFRGGWGASAAEFVGGVSDALERLEDLVDNSLIQSEEDGDGQTRFSLRETIREFAKRHLNDTQAARRKHREWLRAHPNEGDANLEAAWLSALEDADADDAYALLIETEEGWLRILGAERAQALAERTLALSPPTPRLHLLALSQAASFPILRGESAQAFALAAIAKKEAGADHELRAHALLLAARVGIAFYEPPAQIEALLQESLTLLGDGEKTKLHAVAYHRLGIVALRKNSPAAAGILFARAAHIYQREGNTTSARYSRANQARAIGDLGDSVRERELLQICLAEARASNDRTHESLLLPNIALVQGKLGNWNEARLLEMEGFSLCLALGNFRTLAFLFWNSPETLLHCGEPKQAVRTMGFAAKLWTTKIGKLSAGDHNEIAAFRSQAVALLGDADFDTLWAEGQQKTLAEALTLAMDRGLSVAS